MLKERIVDKLISAPYAQIDFSIVSVRLVFESDYCESECVNCHGGCSFEVVPFPTRFIFPIKR